MARRRCWGRGWRCVTWWRTRPRTPTSRRRGRWRWAHAPGLDRWPHGLGGGLPRYGGKQVDPQALRRAYLARDVTYLLGTADTDAGHRQLDRSCAGEAQGATRLARGLAFVAVVVGADTHQRVLEVPGVGHNSTRMLASGCGRLALFGAGECAAADRPVPGR